MLIPGSSMPGVVLYFDREGTLDTVNIPPENTLVYDADPDRKCLMNWKTKQMELLTEDEYGRLERGAGVQ